MPLNIKSLRSCYNDVEDDDNITYFRNVLLGNFIKFALKKNTICIKI